jgi:TetR/AcrR family transcriptional regulator, transcriptional repressor for nem operon
MVAGDSQNKDRTRAALIELGGAAAKKHGFAGLGVDAIAKAAGYTSGALYKHFQDKATLLKEIVHSELSQASQALMPPVQGDTSHLEGKMDDYLSLHHVLHPEIGALIPALGPEVARASKDIKAEYEKQLLSLQNSLLKSVKTPEQAWVILSLSAGAVMLARGMVDEDMSTDILKAARDHLQATIIDPCKRR